MFLNNKYTKWYYDLMSKRQVTSFEGYGENHHIIPKSLGGTNEKANIVRLTAREHALAHILLVRITTGADRSKMAYALCRILNGPYGSKLSPKSYSLLRRQISIATSGKNSPFFGKKRTPMSEDQKKKLSIALKGKKQNQPKWSEERKRARSAQMTGKPQRSPSTETRAKIGDAHRGKQISAEQRKLISEKLSGRTVSEETKQKMREARLRYVREKASRSE